METAKVLMGENLSVRMAQATGTEMTGASDAKAGPTAREEWDRPYRNK